MPETSVLPVTPRISLIMATYGRSTEIGGLVDSLAAQTEQRFELIIADQNLDERVRPYVEQAQAAGIAVQHLRLSQPGLSAARNAGLELASGEWIAYPDDDCWYEPDTLAQLFALAALDPSLTCLIGEWMEHAEIVSPAPLDAGRQEGRRWRQFRGGDASSYTLFMRREAVTRLGGCDASLGVGRWFASGEETDLLMRLLEAGAVVERTRAIRVHHRYVRAEVWASLSSVWGFHCSRERGTGAIYAKHRLSAWVILRGFVMPLLRALDLRQGVSGVVKGVATTTGRVQGWLCWPRV